MGQLGIPKSEFWKLTFREFWAIYYGRFGRTERAPSKKDVSKWEKAWADKRAEKRAMKNGK